jgi:hypothetical protein
MLLLVRVEGGNVHPAPGLRGEADGALQGSYA